MFQKNDGSLDNYKLHNIYKFGLASLTIFLLFLTWTIPNTAYAESGKRICLHENGNFAIKINKGFFRKRNCNKYGIGDRYTSVPSGKGIYMTCEAYAKNHIKWEGGAGSSKFDPCPSMKSTPNSHNPGSSQLYDVNQAAKDEAIKGTGRVCGASSCTLYYDFSSGTSLSVSTSGIGGLVGFGASSSRGSSQGGLVSWESGLEPGLQTYFIGLNKANYRNITEIKGTFREYSKGIPVSQKSQEVKYTNKFCKKGDIFYLGIKGTKVRAVESYTGIRAYKTILTGSRGTVLTQLDDEYNIALSDSAFLEIVGYGSSERIVNAQAPSNTEFFACSMFAEIITSPTKWRSGGDLVLDWAIRLHGPGVKTQASSVTLSGLRNIHSNF